ncbi:MAG: UDP-N-acetylmuramoyl-L-alanyl-D-glutamate--2,6-diaminopimelate ligase [Planctomycetes bacterium]|nr:UDP-N-acetylmuramoyl-L-alanyl-D-glutamate--2,6-diaminopimelate ligase [Planctomycetota bacterium]
MNLQQLIGKLPVGVRAGTVDLDVRDVVEDSRDASPGALFVARRGLVSDGRRFIDDAVAAGAVAVLTENDATTVTGATHLVAADVPAAAAHLAERVHGAPSAALKLVGITGTNGKTTVAMILHQVLNGAGVRCGLMGTVAIDDGSGRAEATLTTPQAAESSRLLRRMVDHGCRACVMEASSHALDQGRTAALAMAGAIFTNVSGDHLDYHGTMERYVAAKTRLFASVGPDGWAVVNADDDEAPTMIAACDGHVFTTSLHDRDAACFAEIGTLTAAGTDVRLVGPWGTIAVVLPLVGRHNVANALQATAAAHALGVDAATIRRGLESVGAPPGRLEAVSARDDDVTVLVDYAHTDDALTNVLTAVRPLVPDGARLITVFGCGGDRDRTKRPRMAAAAARLSDEVFVTSDNPRTEDPDGIIEEIVNGLPAGSGDRARRNVDRADAITEAVTEARPGDVVVVAGKGHETYQIIGTTRRPFDDRIVAREALALRGSMRQGATP